MCPPCINVAILSQFSAINFLHFVCNSALGVTSSEDTQSLKPNLVIELKLIISTGLNMSHTDGVLYHSVNS